ncbi:type VII secretion protein EccB (plasmid) [Streptomyces scopuliridis]|uniref:Type VII secretion protein EccB n=1 Tax=Streptomyces scopuliridis TaxID=452529 RepID=A0ACD5A2Z7_9ACTN|nr:type VII secretion protein EccB [Streptomyces scopuliridis]WSC03502.1 type VII secretion protein EccB [Streptomyces scopuliridis]WSC11353.1 type VII secretion protein EccB [Streptomyces scopuliridis]
MQNRRDQVQAHMFVMGRLTSGLLRTDLDAPESPVGRTNRGLAIGVIVSLLIAAGAFIWGLISPSTSNSWRAEGTLIVDQDTGSRYFFDNGELRPVLNYASAKLLAGASRSGLTSKAVGTESLRGTPRGIAVGITGAPDVLPDSGALSDSRPWLVCSASADGAGTEATVLSVASDAAQRPLPRGSALLVADPSGTRHLVWQGTRLRIDSKSSALEGLGYGSAPPRRVSAAFIDALPAGPDLAPVALTGLGERGPSFGSLTTRIGQVFRTSVPGAERGQYYLLREEGLVPLTNTQAALQLSAPETARRAYEGRPASARELEAGTLKGHLAPGGDGPAADAAEGMPESPPTLAEIEEDQGVCSSVTPGSASGPGVQVGLALVGQDALGPAAKRSATGVTDACLAVDAVVVEPGGGALVRAGTAAGGDAGGSLYLVTDTGVKYRLPTDEDVSALGYSGAQARTVPSLLLSMLPTGPELGSAAAAVTPDSREVPVESACGGRGSTADGEKASVSRGKSGQRDAW